MTAPEPANRRSGLVRLASATGWLSAAIILSLGSAGIVGGMGRSSGDGSRPELTWAADQAVRPGLASAATDLGHLSDEVDSLGQAGRNAIALLVDRDTPTLNATIAIGTDLVSSISADSAAIRIKLAGLPGIATGDETTIGADLRQRYDALTVALSATAGLRTSWVDLTTGSAVASALTSDLADHDTYAGQAIKLGSAAQYAKALVPLAQAQAALASATVRRDALAANTIDVSVLSAWIDRNGAFDTAASTLYKLLEASPHKVTPAIRAAFADLTLARQNLPPDTKALVVILGDLARGGLNQAVIEIEVAKRNLSNAVALIVGSGSPPGP